jgi:hypothetical protein
MKIKKKVLIVANNGPEPSFGGGQRNILIGKLMESLGYEVEMILLIDKNWGIYDIESTLFDEWRKIFKINRVFQPSFRKPFFPNFEVFQYLNKIQNEYEWIIFRYEKTAFKSVFYFLKKRKNNYRFRRFYFTKSQRI